MMIRNGESGGGYVMVVLRGWVKWWRFLQREGKREKGNGFSKKDKYKEMGMRRRGGGWVVPVKRS